MRNESAKRLTAAQSRHMFCNALHRRLMCDPRNVYSVWTATGGRRIMGERNVQRPGSIYEEWFRRSVADPAAFWLEQAELLDWHSPPARGLDYDGAESCNWYPDGRLNSTYQALNRWVQSGRG